jgi:uncharacterized Zn-binding protein involved in type VI secretion
MQLSTTKNTLALTKDNLSTTQTELTTTQDNLNTTQVQLSTTQNELSSTRSSLTTTQGQLATTQGQLTTTQNTLIATQSSLTAAQIQEATLQTSLTAAASQVTALQNQLSTGHILVDPTYASMQAFIASDKTDQNTYNASTYDCVNFSADVIANAAKQNIRCAFVNIDFPGSGHAIVVFNTTDKGMIYIEPQNDDIVNLKVEAHYYQEEVPPPGYYYLPPSYDDTVTRFVVVW